MQFKDKNYFHTISHLQFKDWTIFIKIPLAIQRLNYFHKDPTIDSKITNNFAKSNHNFQRLMRIPTSIAPGSSKSSLFTQNFHKRVQMNIVAKLFGKKKKESCCRLQLSHAFHQQTQSSLLCISFGCLQWEEHCLIHQACKQRATRVQLQNSQTKF